MPHVAKLNGSGHHHARALSPVPHTHTLVNQLIKFLEGFSHYLNEKSSTRLAMVKARLNFGQLSAVDSLRGSL